MVDFKRDKNNKIDKKIQKAKREKRKGEFDQELYGRMLKSNLSDDDKKLSAEKLKESKSKIKEQDKLITSLEAEAEINRLNKEVSDLEKEKDKVMIQLNRSRMNPMQAQKEENKFAFRMSSTQIRKGEKKFNLAGEVKKQTNVIKDIEAKIIDKKQLIENHKKNIVEKRISRDFLGNSLERKQTSTRDDSDQKKENAWKPGQMIKK